VPDLQVLLDLVNQDPILGYSLVAALFLALVSLVSGLLRLDFLALLRPLVLLHVILAVILGFLLLQLSQGIGPLLGGSATEPPSSAGGWLLEGLDRFPLYLVALAYGPSIGLFTAGLFAAFESAAAASGYREALLALELVLVGWLAIYPSPHNHRWAGPLNALLAYLLAWSTAGVALLQYQQGDVGIPALLRQHRPLLPGVAASILLLLLIGPQLYRNVFRNSRIAPPPKPVDAPEAVVLLTIEHEHQRQHPEMPEPGIPEAVYRRRRPRKLGPPPDFEE